MDASDVKLLKKYMKNELIKRILYKMRMWWEDYDIDRMIAYESCDSRETFKLRNKYMIESKNLEELKVIDTLIDLIENQELMMVDEEVWSEWESMRFYFNDKGKIVLSHYR
jgi:hypothetical protein